MSTLVLKLKLLQSTCTVLTFATSDTKGPLLARGVSGHATRPPSLLHRCSTRRLATAALATFALASGLPPCGRRTTIRLFILLCISLATAFGSIELPWWLDPSLLLWGQQPQIGSILTRIQLVGLKPSQGFPSQICHIFKSRPFQGCCLQEGSLRDITPLCHVNQNEMALSKFACATYNDLSVLWRRGGTVTGMPCTNCTAFICSLTPSRRGAHVRR